MSKHPAYVVFVLFAMTLAALPALAKVLDASPSGFTIENSAIVPVDLSTAWQALVGNVDSWWPKDHTWWGASSRLTIDARAGGCFCEIGANRQAQHMQVICRSTKVAANDRWPRAAAGHGPIGVLEWRMAAVAGGTQITLWYRAGGYSPDDLGKIAPVVDTVQALQLGNLVHYLRDRVTQPGKKPR